MIFVNGAPRAKPARPGRGSDDVGSVIDRCIAVAAWKRRQQRYALLGSSALLAVAALSAATPSPAQAQFICQQNGGTTGGSTATNPIDMACGIGTSATSTTFTTPAFAVGIRASAMGNQTTAVGAATGALSTGASAFGYAAFAAGTSSTAIGMQAFSGASTTFNGATFDTPTFSNNNGTAIGANAAAGTSATGQNNATALGESATANGLNAIANGIVRPCSCPASDGSWEGALKTRSTPCLRTQTLRSQ